MTSDTHSDSIDIGSRRELMVDDFLIDSISGGAELRLHHPVERTTTFTCDRPWEGDWSGNPAFIQDGDIYRMYYRFDVTGCQTALPVLPVLCRER